MNIVLTAETPEQTFAAGEELGRSLRGGELVLLFGSLGAGKTLFTKGLMQGLGFDVDEVTSPSFTLVNKYETNDLDVYHIDLWRLDEAAGPAEAVGLDEILEGPRAVAVIEWAERLGSYIHNDKISVEILGDGDGPRQIVIRSITKS